MECQRQWLLSGVLGRKAQNNERDSWYTKPHAWVRFCQCVEIPPYPLSGHIAFLVSRWQGLTHVTRPYQKCYLLATCICTSVPDLLSPHLPTESIERRCAENSPMLPQSRISLCTFEIYRLKIHSCLNTFTFLTTLHENISSHDFSDSTYFIFRYYVKSKLNHEFNINYDMKDP